MCFVNDDCGWIAQVWEESTATAAESFRCMECGRTLPAGATRHDVYIQQHEACRQCDEDARAEWDEAYTADVPLGDKLPPLVPCADDEHDYGETFDYQRCEDCEAFLQAIENAELVAGCSRHEARPPLEMMRESLGDGGKAEAKRYWKYAATNCQALKANGYLAWLWRNVFAS